MMRGGVIVYCIVMFCFLLRVFGEFFFFWFFCFWVLEYIFCGGFRYCSMFDSPNLWRL
jgi:hypothetical protein